jgi:ATP-dependent DNA helicase RecG
MIAGALTLLADPSTRLGKRYVDIFRYTGEGVDYDRRVEITGAVQIIVAQATEFLAGELGADLVVRGARRLELPKLPVVVIREAVANAVAHRSYEDPGRAVRIEIRPDRVVVESPGGLPEPVTEANIRETQSARNPHVLRVLRQLRLAEDSGRGVDVMIDSMAAELLDPPTFHDTGHSVRVTLPTRGAVSPPERAWVLALERQRRLQPRDRILLVHAARGELLSNERAREFLGVDSRVAGATLRRLRDEGLLEQVGTRGGARYVLSRAFAAPAAFHLTPTELRELVVKMADQGPVTNARVRAETGLDRAETLRLLRRLVAEGRVVLRGERKGAHYVSARERERRPGER